MQILVPNEIRFLEAEDGTVWVHSTAIYEHWAEYLEVFDEVNVLARVQSVKDVPSSYLRADGPGVKYTNLPYYQGPAQYVSKHRELTDIVQRAVASAEAITLRAPGQISSIVKSIVPAGRPYGVEVIGDPFDVFSPGAVKHPLRSLFRIWFTRQLKGVVKGASSVAYVTESYLQQRYPSSGGAFVTYFSALGVDDAYYLQEPRTFAGGSRLVRCITVGSLEQLYKGTDVLIKAVSLCRERGADLSLTIVGDGRYRSDLQKISEELGLEGRVHFLGQLPSGDAVREQLDRSDIFILPSRTEGLPRAMIEAMSRGLPAIGSSVGGIPELLSDEDLVPPGDAKALAAKLYEVLIDTDRMAQMSRRNLQRARNYSLGNIKKRKGGYHQALRDQTQQWLLGKRPL